MPPDPPTAIADALEALTPADADALRAALVSVTAIRTYGDLLVELGRDGGLSEALDAAVYERIGVACGVRAPQEKPKKKVPID